MDYVIIVAGGKGLRMGTETPKQFLPVAGKPTTDAHYRALLRIQPRHQHHPCVAREPAGILAPALRGASFRHQAPDSQWWRHRFQSSKNGLALIPDDADGVVGIHDGVRPFVSTSVIDECYETAREEYAAIPVYAVTDTLRYIDQRGGGKNVMRDDYRVVQTPQTFDIALAKQAFNQGYKAQFTDDASVVESLGCQVAMVEGNRENIKITTPFDIKVAEALLAE